MELVNLFKRFRKDNKTEKKEKLDKIEELDEIVQKIEEPSENNDSQETYTLNVDNIMKKKTSMCDLWKVYYSKDDTESFKPLEYIEKTIIEAKEKTKKELLSDVARFDKNESELSKFIQEIQIYCQNIITKMKNEKLTAEKNKETEKTGVVYSSVNAETLLYMTKDKLRLWAVIIPPFYGGTDITADYINMKILSMAVKNGIDHEIIKMMCSNKFYFKIIQVAFGKEAINGKDGHIENLFSKTRNKINIKEDTNGNVNYKELNMIQSIHKGDPISKITPPTLATDGITITGEVIKGKDGKLPAVQAGRNTVLSEDKTQLIANIDGEVIYEGSKFNVINLLTIDDDVDNAIGNINFAGDVLIKGDVREGYTVKADGNVKIMGTVEGATVITGGDLVIERGMTGGNKGVIETQGTLKCKYLENCRVYAKKGIEADQIMYSILSTDENIIVKGKKGSVTGGKLIAGILIEAMTVGTYANSNLKTEIVIGTVPQLVEHEKNLKVQLDEIEKAFNRFVQDISYIENMQSKVSDERKELLKNLKFKYQISQAQKNKLEQKLEEVRQKIQSNTEMCSFKCKNVYPLVHFNVCGSTYVLDMELTECKVSRKAENTYIMSPGLAEMIIF